MFLARSPAPKWWPTATPSSGIGPTPSKWPHTGHRFTAESRRCSCLLSSHLHEPRGSQVCWTTSVFILRSEGIMPVAVGTGYSREQERGKKKLLCLFFCNTWLLTNKQTNSATKETGDKNPCVIRPGPNIYHLPLHRCQYSSRYRSGAGKPGAVALCVVFLSAGLRLGIYTTPLEPFTPVPDQSHLSWEPDRPTWAQSQFTYNQRVRSPPHFTACLKAPCLDWGKLQLYMAETGQTPGPEQWDEKLLFKWFQLSWFTSRKH